MAAFITKDSSGIHTLLGFATVQQSCKLIPIETPVQPRHLTPKRWSRSGVPPVCEGNLLQAVDMSPTATAFLTVGVIHVQRVPLHLRLVSLLP